MEYADYVQQISFRLFQPAAPRPQGFRTLNRLARGVGIHLEMWMTNLPEGQEEMQERLKKVCRVRHRSTFAIGAIINRGVAELSGSEAFLSLGVDRGFPLFAGMAGHRDRVCIGVDPLGRRPATREAFLMRFGRWKSPRHEFHERPFREYFQEVHQGAVGLLACQGLETWEDQHDALRLAEPFVRVGGHILVNESNRPEIRRGVQEFLAASLYEYHPVLDVRTPHNRHPTYWNGLMLLRRKERKAGEQRPWQDIRKAA
ncbi:MAG: hypothetical protein ACKV0T_10430 [Planctomycetales bacterium]